MSSWLNRSAPKRKVIYSNQQEYNTQNINNTINVNTTNKSKSTANELYNIKNGYNHMFLSNFDISIINIIKDLHSTKIRTLNINNGTSIYKIVNVYKPQYKNAINAIGLGDFIRGSIFLYQLCKINNMEFDINLRYHLIGKYFINSNNNEIDEHILNNIIDTKIMHYLHERTIPNIDMNNINHVNHIKNNALIYTIRPFYNQFSKLTTIKDGILYVYHHAFPLFEINDDDKLFIKNKFSFNSQITDKYNLLTSIINISPKMYKVLHIRTGDEIIYGTNILHKQKLINNIEIFLSTYNDIQDILVLSDSDELKKYLTNKYKYIKVINSHISHLGQSNSFTDDGIIDTLTDIEIISNSTEVISFTNYHHGSGFAIWPAIINNVKYSSTFIN